MSIMLIEELARDRMQTLLREAEAGRRAAELARAHRGRATGAGRPGVLRQAVGRWLMAAGARLAGAGAARAVR